MLKEFYKFEGPRPAALFTTHNLEYQGFFPGDMALSRNDPLVGHLFRLGVLGCASCRFNDPRGNTYPLMPEALNVEELFKLTQLPADIQTGAMEFWSRYPNGYIPGRHNFMKGAFNYADKIVFVSQGHLREALTIKRGYGLDGVLRDNLHKLTAIYNGLRGSKWRSENLAGLRRGRVRRPYRRRQRGLERT